MHLDCSLKASWALYGPQGTLGNTADLVPVPLLLQHMDALTPEIHSLREGEYVGVRRFTRILERGTEAKSDLDRVIDRCGSLVNLRTAIMRYRKPRRWFRFYR